MPDEKRVPRVSVCMSMRNAEAYVGECVASILGQSFSDFELLIADDGSTDGSVAVVCGFDDDRIRLIERDHDFVGSLNCVMSQARGKYIARMDADDVMLPERLSRQYEYMEAHGDVAAVSGEAIRIDEAGNRIGRIGGGGAEQEITARMMCEGNCVCNPSTMVRRDFIMKHGLVYEREFVYAEDYRFWSRVVAEGGRIVSLPGAVIKYRHSAGQVTATRTVEMEAASERIRRELTSALIDKQNKGYVDPEISDRGNELTLIIPFLNEGEEVERTVRSFMSHSGSRVDVIVINDGSYDSYPYMDRLGEIEGVSYVLNRERLGVAGSRDKGVELCKTPYFLLLDAHMRAYDDKWVTEIPRLLRENDRRVLCCQTLALRRNSDGNIGVNIEGSQSYGAIMTLEGDGLLPGIKWITEEQNPESDIEQIPAILGAGYCMSKRYWNRIGGLKGLMQYGCDEQYISLKTYLEGGVCVLLKKIVLGHIYRDEAPYTQQRDCLMYNSMLISETLFPLKEKCQARANAYVMNKANFQKRFREVTMYLNDNSDVRTQIDAFVGRSFREVKSMNRVGISLDTELENKIVSRLDEIYQHLIEDTEALNAGIATGLCGQAIWLYHYASLSNSAIAYEQAGLRLTEALNKRSNDDLSFGSGLSGIGWGLLYLEKKGIGKAPAHIIDEIDALITDYLYNGSLRDVSFLNGIGGIISYICQRLNSKSGVAYYAEHEGKIEEIARIMLARTNNPVTAYYGLLWLQLKAIKFTIEQDHELTDWINPSNYLSRDPQYWSYLMSDGVLATSVNVMMHKLTHVK